jgi:hypothetical protein
MKLKTGARSTLKPKKRTRKRKHGQYLQTKKKLDSLVSKWVRLEHLGEDGLIKCSTCDNKTEYKLMQCGHFMSRRYSNTRHHPHNIAPQCRGCNMFAQGRQWLLGRWLDRIHGEGTAEDMYRLSRSKNRITQADLNAIQNDFEQRIEALNKGD